MTIPFEVAKELHEVPESIVKKYARHLKEVEGINPNAFTRLLEFGKTFEHAGLKPIFLATQDGTSFTVSSEETFMKKLH